MTWRCSLFCALVAIASAWLVACWPLLGGALAPEARDASTAPDADVGPIGALTANTTSLRLVQGSSVQVEIGLTRAADFSGGLDIEVTGLPDGVTADSLTFGPSEVSTRALILRAANTAALGATATIEIRGTAPQGTTSPLDLPLQVQGLSGTLDTTFGTGGTTTVAVQSVQVGIAGGGLVIDAQERIVFCGSIQTNVGYPLLVGRLTGDGHVDRSFAKNGVYTDLPPGYFSENCASVELHPSGGVALAGYSAPPSTSGHHNMFGALLDEHGKPDKSFGSTGFVTIDNSGADAKAYTLEVQPNGDFVLGGFQPSGTSALVRVLRDGGTDPSFDPAPTDAGAIRARTFEDAGVGINRLALVPDSGALLAAIADDTVRAMRFTPQGAIDNAYGTDGTASTPGVAGPLQETGESGATAIVLQTNAAIFVGASGATIEAARFTADGLFDATFGKKGHVSTAVPASTAISVRAAAATPENGFVVAFLIDGHDVGTARYTHDGQLDTTFNGTGIVRLSTQGAAEGASVTLDQWGRIVVAAGKGSSVSVARYWP